MPIILLPDPATAETVTYTEKDPAGNPHSRVPVRIRLIAARPGAGPGYVPGSDYSIEGELGIRTDDDGVWAVALVPNVLISPANTYYIADVQPAVGQPVRHVFSVPDAPGPHQVIDILTNPPANLPSLHNTASTGAHPASAVSVNSTSGLAATNVQAALAELDGAVEDRALVADLAAETNRATAAEDALAAAVDDRALTTALANETNRATAAEALAAQKSANLADLASAPAARTNLGLGSAATQPSTAFDPAGSAAAAQAAAVQRSNHTGTQAISTVTGLQPALDAKAPQSALDAEAAARANADAAKADLVGGLVPVAQLPSIAISDYLGDVASQAAMLALTGQRGDWATRSDLSAAFILVGDDASVLSNWKQLPTPASAVASVNGRTGVVTGLAEQADLTAEVNRATAAEANLTTAVNDRARAADLTAETNRATAAEALAAQKSANLSDLASATAARTNLGLGSAATQPSTAFDPAGSAAAAQAAAVQRANHTGFQAAVTISDLPEAAQDAVGAALTDTATLDLTYDDGAGTIRGTVLDSPTVGGATPAQLRDRSTHTGTQAISTVSGLQPALDARALASALATETNERINADVLKADLVGGKVPSDQLPAIAISDVFTVASEAAMAALPAQRGDVAIRTDLSQTFILSSDSPGSLADWKLIQSPADAVSSVNGRVGAVTGLAEQAALTNEVNRATAAEAAAVQRANHTGFQAAVTISDLPEAAQDAVGAALTDTATLDLTYDDGAGTIRGTVLDSPTVGGASAGQLRDRTTHTGAQAISTVTGLQAELDAKAAVVTSAGAVVRALAPSGVDDTDAIEALAAFSDVVALGPGTFIYNGTGLDKASLEIDGDSKDTTTVNLGANSSLVRRTAGITGLKVSNLRTVGGTIPVFQPFTGTDTAGTFRVVESCYFYNYTVAGVVSLASDCPYWQVRGNIFWAANDTSTIGVALAGLTDSCGIENNDFRMNRIDVKLGMGGNNARLNGNGFVRFGAYTGTPRVNVWIVPSTSSPNSGSGFTLTPANKFGNENMNVADYRIVYADEDTSTGTDFSNRYPDLNADSAGFITGHRVGGTFFGIGDPGTNKPLIYSTTPNLRGTTWGDIRTDGGESHVVGVRTVPLPADRTNRDNVIGPVASSGAPWGAAVVATNADGLARLDDPQGSMGVGTPLAPQPLTSSNPADYVNQLTVGIRAFNLSSATLADIADAYGGADASEMTVTAANGGVTRDGVVAAPTTRNMWIEFEVAPGSSSPLSVLRVILQDWTSALHRSWFVTIPASGWVPVTLGPHNWRPPAGGGWALVFAGLTTGKVKIGRVRMYQARNPVLKDLSIANVATSGPAGAATGSFTVYINGVARQVNFT